MEGAFLGPGRRAHLLGRARECALLNDVVSAIRRGEGRSLVLRGEAGIGKTALLEYLVESASDLTVVRAVGVESEMELAYASLHQLCGPLLNRLWMLPPPQRRALEVVFGLSDGDAPDRFLVGLAVLSLVSEVSGDRPMLCVIDDAQWLDQASASSLAFVARRLLADPVGLVFAAREPGELQSVPELEVKGLVDGDARALLGSAVMFKLDEQVRERIVAETRGNPLALLELPQRLTATQLAGGFGLVDARDLSGRIEESFVRLGRYHEALAAAQEVGPQDLNTENWAISEQIEAAARGGRLEIAADGVRRLQEITHDGGTDWGLGLSARCAALVSEGDAAENLYREAIERLARTRLRPELARAHLAFGEWLRREGRRVDARAHLRTAHDTLAGMGMEAFADRARRELLATGEKARKRIVETRDDLTAQERQIAELARDGLSNPRIGARLFLSPKTVEWHLHKVFGKLGIRSRHELADALQSSGPELAQA
jgi:DNA-binding CsgD family transcriptional regulator